MEYLLLIIIPILVTVMITSIYAIMHDMLYFGGSFFVFVQIVVICHLSVLVILGLENYYLTLIGKLINLIHT